MVDRVEVESTTVCLQGSLARPQYMPAPTTFISNFSKNNYLNLVEVDGIEPTTSCLQSTCSTN